MIEETKYKINPYIDLIIRIFILPIFILIGLVCLVGHCYNFLTESCFDE